MSALRVGHNVWGQDINSDQMKQFDDGGGQISDIIMVINQMDKVIIAV